MRRERFVNPWTSEEEIAAVARQALESLGWIVHPETGGFDLLAVAGKGCQTRPARPGDVLGVECKLDAGTLAGVESLLRQAMPAPKRPGWKREAMTWDFYRPHRGVHFRAVVSSRIRCRETFRAWGVETVETVSFRGERQSVEHVARMLGHFGVRVEPENLPYIPEIVIDVPAGAPSPRTSSRWKVAAVRTMLRLLDGERLTSADFREAGLNAARFAAQKWIVDSGERKGRAYVWTVGPGVDGWTPPPHVNYPEIAAALREKDLEGAA